MPSFVNHTRDLTPSKVNRIFMTQRQLREKIHLLLKSRDALAVVSTSLVLSPAPIVPLGVTSSVLLLVALVAPLASASAFIRTTVLLS